jgi:dolichol-phosphate mannosyltransferase
MDADLQHPTQMIVPLVDCAVEHQADIVIASRYVKGGSDAGLSSSSRKLISWAARWLVTLLLFDKLRGIHDPLSGFFVARKPIVDETVLRPIGFKILLDILARCDYSIVKEQPLRFAERGGGTSKATISQGRDFLTHVIALVWEVRVARHFRRRTRPAIEPDA